MAPGTIEQVRILRQQIPVGYTEGLATLTACDGNIGNAVILLQQRYIAVVAKATKLQADTILPVLIQNQYDTTQTIQQLEEAHRLVNGVPQPETAYTLHRWQAHKEHAVNSIADSLMQH